jgi:hypothetical protein
MKVHVAYLSPLEGAGSPPNGTGWYWRYEGSNAPPIGPFLTYTDALKYYRFMRVASASESRNG